MALQLRDEDIVRSLSTRHYLEEIKELKEENKNLKEYLALHRVNYREIYPHRTEWKEIMLDND